MWRQVAHSCVDYCQTQTPGLANIVVDLNVLLVLKGMIRYRTAAKETSFMNLHVRYATLAKKKRKDPRRLVMTEEIL